MTTTLTHTAAVLLIAGLLPIFLPNVLPQDVQRILELIGGGLVTALGLFLLHRRLTGGHDHIHIGGGHHHHHHHGHDHDHTHDHPHPHDHDHVHGVTTHVHGPHTHVHGVATAPAEAPVAAVRPEKVGWQQLIVLGVSGGIVPCWDAFFLLVVAIGAGRLWVALPLLLAFSAGLAGVLVAIGVGVVCARNFADKRWGGVERLRPLVRALPLLSALFITAMGLWLCYASFHAD